MQDDPVFRLKRPATRDAPEVFRQEIVRFASGAGASDVAVSAVKLAISETVTNAVVHAFVGRDPGAVCVEARVVEDGLIVIVCDDGSGMSPRPDSPGLGLGLPLIANVADDVRVGDCGGRGTRVSMRFSLDGSGSALAPTPAP